MMQIKCCNGCVPPKRHTACHDHCPVHLKEKAEYEAKKAIADREKSISNGLYDQRANALAKIMKGRKAYGFQGKGNGSDG